MSLLPLFLDLRSRRVVIFGGGQVAERKARLFSEYSEVTVVSRTFAPSLEELARDGKIKIVEADLPTGARGYLEGVFLAIPATDDPRLNMSLERLAEELGVLVNRVDGVGDVVVPSVVRRGPLNIAISTLGESPALSRYLRIRLEEELDERYAKMARLLGALRPEIKLWVADQEERRDILWNILLDEEIWSLLGKSYEKAHEKAFKRARELVSQDERDSLNAGDPQDGEHKRD